MFHVEQMEKFESCPICDSSELISFVKTKDFTTTGEEFNIDQCSNCRFRFTNPRPSFRESSRYYESPDYISHTDSSQGLLNRLYQLAKSFALKQKIGLVKDLVYQSNAKILDYGCGTGDFLVTAQNNSFNTLGVEPVDSAREKAMEKGIEVINYEEFYNLQQNSFDIITLWHVLEHVHELDKVMAHLCNLLKPNGYLFIALPNSDSTDSLIYDKFWAAYDVPRHLYHFTPASFSNFVNKYPLKPISKKAMPFDPFYICLLSEKYQSGKGNFLSAFYNGLTGFISGYKNVDKASSIIYILQKV